MAAGKRYLLVLVWLIVQVIATCGVANAQEPPQFKLGFKALANLLPGIVGEPLENEHFDPTNGNSLQQTTKGLLVWRKADNRTAFTDGQRSWIIGPFGVQERANDARFPWEGESTANATSATLEGSQYKIIPLPSASRPDGRQSYTPTIKAMDEESASQSATISEFVQAIDAKWSKVWGWRPRLPVTVYLYFDGNRMADGIASISGVSLTPSRKGEIATAVAGMKALDRQTGGWAIFMNLNKWFGTDLWAIRAKHLFAHEYTHVMQSDVAGAVGPTWFIEGMAELSAFNEVPEAMPFLGRTKYVVLARSRGDLPSLMYLQTGWAEMTSTQGERAQLAYGISYLAAKYLADKAGSMALLQVLEKTAKGQGFESALRDVTGFSLDRLDAEYKQLIPNSAQQP